MIKLYFSKTRHTFASALDYYWHPLFYSILVEFLVVHSLTGEACSLLSLLLFQDVKNHSQVLLKLSKCETRYYWRTWGDSQWFILRNSWGWVKGSTYEGSWGINEDDSNKTTTSNQTNQLGDPLLVIAQILWMLQSHHLQAYLYLRSRRLSSSHHFR